MDNGNRNAALDMTSKGHTVSLQNCKGKGQSQMEGGSIQTTSITYSADYYVSPCQLQQGKQEEGQIS